MSANRGKINHLEADAYRRLVEVLSRVSGWEVRNAEGDRVEMLMANDSVRNPDFVLSVRNPRTGRNLEFVVEVKSRLQPREAREVVSQLNEYRRLSEVGGGNYCPVAIAPNLSLAVRDLLEKEGIGWMDFGGNAHLDFDGHFIHIEGRPVPTEYKERSPQKSLFTPKATRLLRVLLQGPIHAHKVEELAGAAGVSLGLVSKVRKLLLDQELAVDGKEGIKIKRPQEILRDWILADDFRNRVETREYSLLEQDHAEIATIMDSELNDNGVRHAFTQWTAAHLRHPHVPPQITSLYVESFPDEELLKRVLKVRRVDAGGRLWLHRPADAGVFIGQQTVYGRPLVSDVQIFLDLLETGDQLRANEAARELRDDPNFNGGWR
ncbi:MAG: type IV toxin-antitoxin system AbiEi family antitoxin [Verrucomicrobiota bacterium]